MTSVPVGQVCAQLGLTGARELFGGRQSTVLRAEFAGTPVVLKLIDAIDVERQLLGTRVAMVSTLAGLSHTVCAPVAIRDTFVHEFNLAGSSRCYGICYEFAAGVPPDVGDPDDAALMGRELGRLHRYMAQLPAADLPVITGFAVLPRRSFPSVGLNNCCTETSIQRTSVLHRAGRGSSTSTILATVRSSSTLPRRSTSNCSTWAEGGLAATPPSGGTSSTRTPSPQAPNGRQTRWTP